ncbi:DUF3717 domain-containing protein [Paraburkholderia sp. MM5477-R1]|uniref:DUF3717 domain-containing protein n=1 Tax=Paraburkholderia sp. MM5477-R1 TaxID=2991062 RepID=UPI003D1C8031
MVEIERAINYWCTQEPAGPDGALCARACALAAVYDPMIYERATSVAVARLTSEQVAAVRIALDLRHPQRPPP